MNLDQLNISHHWAADEVYSKRTLIPAGVILTQHVHPYDHASALVSGTAVVEVDGISEVHEAPKMLMIKAGRAHSVSALTDVVWHCIHVTSDTNPETVDQTILT